MNVKQSGFLVIIGKGIIPRILKGNPLFSGLTEKQLALIESISETRSVKKGAVIIREGELDGELYLVIKGEVEVLNTGTRHSRQ